MGKKALILSGGSIKGAFQVGAMQAVFEQGFRPDIMLGISIGAVNSTYFVNKIGEKENIISNLQALEDLKQFWFDHTRNPRQIMKRRSLLRLGYDLITNNFRSLMDTSNYFAWFNNLKPEYIKRSRIKLMVGAVNLYSGEIEYFDSNNPNIVEAAKASSIIPLIMPPVIINGIPYVDGGVKDVVPLRPLVDNHEISELVIIITHPVRLSNKKFNIGNINHYITRTKNITVNEIIQGDLDDIKDFNRRQLLILKKPIKYKIIRPQDELEFTLDKFTPDDIRYMMDLGYKTAMQAQWEKN